MDDCVIVGGGVIGLSLAYQLAGAGLRVRVLERYQPGRATSWAGAGILPPKKAGAEDAPFAQLAALSYRLHLQWAEQLQAQTGIDTGLRRSGGLYLARDPQTAATLAQQAADWRRSGVEVEELDPQAVEALEPELSRDARDTLQAAYRLPGEYQLRNPRHLKALVAACHLRGVEITSGVAVDDFVVRRGEMKEVVAGGTAIPAGLFCITAGPWSNALLERLGYSPTIKPIRGQILMLQTPAPPLRQIVNVGRRYLVPRPDGRTLVGSTEEEAGFDARPTAAGISTLLAMALELVPRLQTAEIERTWAGLRPATADGLPYLGRLPSVANAFVAAGHYRAGIELSPGTARVMSQLLQGHPPEIDLEPFRVDRHPTPAAKSAHRA